MWVAIMVYMFKALGIICDEYFVPSLEVIVEKLQLSNDVAGATFMAAGSSAPELFTSLVATFLIVNEGGVGTIVGSAIFNILVIVGATGYIACKEQALKIWWYPLSRDCFFYTVSITELIVVVHNEHVEWWEALVMIFTYALYCIYMKFNPDIVRILGIVDPSESTTECETEQDTVNGNFVVKNTVVEEIVVIEATKSAPLEEKGSVDSIGSSVVTAVSTNHSQLRSLASADGEKANGRQLELPGGATTPGTVDTEVQEVRYESDQTKESRTNSKGSNKKDSLTVPGSNVLLGKPAGDIDKESNNSKDRRRPSWSYHDHVRSASKGSQGRSPRTASKDNPGQPTGSMVVENGSLKNPEKTATPADGETPVEKANLNGAETTEEAEEETSFLPSWMKDPLVVFWELTMPPPERFGGGLLFTVSIIFIGLCTYVMVDATNRTGVILHIPTLAMARVFLAAGTSIPDALGSIAVAKQGEGDMAVANALGSNVFDILIGLGVPWFIKTALMQKEVHFPGKWDELVYDFIVLSFVLVLFVGCLVIHRWRLTRKVGLLLLGMYFVFLLYNVFAIWIIDPPLVKADEEANCDVL